MLQISPESDKTPLAHYYCEYAQAVKNDDQKAFLDALNKALFHLPSCSRASMLLGDFHLENKQFRLAADYYEAVLSQNVDYIGEVLDKIKHCYLELMISPAMSSF